MQPAGKPFAPGILNRAVQMMQAWCVGITSKKVAGSIFRTRPLEVTRPALDTPAVWRSALGAHHPRTHLSNFPRIDLDNAASR
jgi:hypothetical protein